MSLTLLYTHNNWSYIKAPACRVSPKDGADNPDELTKVSDSGK